MPKVIEFACYRAEIKPRRLVSEPSAWITPMALGELAKPRPSRRPLLLPPPGSLHGCLLIIQVSAQCHLLRDSFPDHSPPVILHSVIPSDYLHGTNHHLTSPVSDLIIVKSPNQNLDFLRARTCFCFISHCDPQSGAEPGTSRYSLNTCWIPKWPLQAR